MLDISQQSLQYNFVSKLGVYLFVYVCLQVIKQQCVAPTFIPPMLIKNFSALYSCVFQTILLIWYTMITNMLWFFAMFACGRYLWLQERLPRRGAWFGIFRNGSNTAVYYFSKRYSKILNYVVRTRHMARSFQFCASGTLTQCLCTFCRINSFC